MNAPASLSKVQQIRARDGDHCWLCHGKLDFKAEPNSKKAPTVEHLLAKANGGTNALDNLVLTHPGCNRQLGARTVKDKEKLRAKFQANREKMLASSRVRADTPVADGGTKGRPPRPEPRVQPDKVQRLKAALRRWQLAAALASGTALLAIGFAAGVVLVV